MEDVLQTQQQILSQTHDVAKSNAELDEVERKLEASQNEVTQIHQESQDAADQLESLEFQISEAQIEQTTLMEVLLDLEQEVHDQPLTVAEIEQLENMTQTAQSKSKELDAQFLEMNKQKLSEKQKWNEAAMKLAQVSQQINSALADYNLFHSFSCSSDGIFTVTGSASKNQDDAANQQDLNGMEVDFTETVLPLIKEKKDEHNEKLDSLCSEMQYLS